MQRGINGDIVGARTARGRSQWRRIIFTTSLEVETRDDGGDELKNRLLFDIFMLPCIKEKVNHYCLLAYRFLCYKRSNLSLEDLF